MRLKTILESGLVALFLGLVALALNLFGVINATLGLITLAAAAIVGTIVVWTTSERNKLLRGTLFILLFAVCSFTVAKFVHKDKDTIDGNTRDLSSGQITPPNNPSGAAQPQNPPASTQKMQSKCDVKTKGDTSPVFCGSSVGGDVSINGRKNK